jgi:acetoin utilization deacetylase AcuC-like enzyme
VVASGFDANGLDPLARMLLHSDSYRWLMGRMLAAADELCQGRVIVEHEGGYSESYVPFCGHALIETLAGERTAVVDPVLDFIKGQQPNAAFMELQRRLIDEQALTLGF